MPGPLIGAGLKGAQILANRIRRHSSEVSQQDQNAQTEHIALQHMAQTHPQDVLDRLDANAETARREHRRRVATRIGLTAAAGAGLTALVLALLPRQNNQATVEYADVFRVSPIGIDCRVLEQSHIEVAASQTFRTPVDHFQVTNPFTLIGPLTRFVERTVQTKSTFTGSNGQGSGEIDNEICFRAKDVSVKVYPRGLEVISIPASSVVQQTGINETQSEVIRDDGDVATMLQAGAHIFGGIKILDFLKNIEAHRARLDTEAREAAVNIGAGACSLAAWHDAKEAATQSYRSIARAQFNAAKNNGSDKIAPSSVSVDITGKLQLIPPYVLPNSVHLTNETGGPVKCQVAHGAYNPGNITDPFGHNLSNGIPIG